MNTYSHLHDSVVRHTQRALLFGCILHAPSATCSPQRPTLEHASRVTRGPQPSGHPEGQLCLGSWQTSLCCKSGEVVCQSLALWHSTACMTSAAVLVVTASLQVMVMPGSETRA